MEDSIKHLFPQQKKMLKAKGRSTNIDRLKET